MSSGIRATIDFELRRARGITLASWLEANAVTSAMLENALSGNDLFGVLNMLAETLGVLPRVLIDRAA